MYNYQNERHKIFTEKGQTDFLKVRDEAFRLLEEAGAFSIMKVIKVVCGESWLMMAYVDRLVELEEIKEITKPDTFGQDRVFVKY